MTMKEKEMDGMVPVRPYGKGELAQLYYPDRDPSWALRLFKQDLLRAPGLIDELRRRGWTPRRRLLRKDWVTRIFAAIEPP